MNVVVKTQICHKTNSLQRMTTIFMSQDKGFSIIAHTTAKKDERQCNWATLKAFPVSTQHLNCTVTRYDNLSVMQKIIWCERGFAWPSGRGRVVWTRDFEFEVPRSIPSLTTTVTLIPRLNYSLTLVLTGQPLTRRMSPTTQDYSQPEDQTTKTTETPRFKPFTIIIILIIIIITIIIIIIIIKTTKY